MSQHPVFGVPAKPAQITLDTLPQLFAHHRARFGGWQMAAQANEQPGEQPPTGPERPDDIPAETWDVLGDTGKQALTRERARALAAERALAAARARPAPPKKPEQPPTAQPPLLTWP